MWSLTSLRLIKPNILCITIHFTHCSQVSYHILYLFFTSTNVTCVRYQNVNFLTPILLLLQLPYESNVYNQTTYYILL